MENVKALTNPTNLLDGYDTPAGCSVQFSQHKGWGGTKISSNKYGAWTKDTGAGPSRYKNSCSADSTYVIGFRDWDSMSPRDGVVLETTSGDDYQPIPENGTVGNDKISTWLVGKTGRLYNSDTQHTVQVPLYSVRRYDDSNRTFTYNSMLPSSMNPVDTGWKIGNSTDPFSQAAEGAVCPSLDGKLIKDKSGLVPGMGGTPTYYNCTYPINDEVVGEINNFLDSGINEATDGRVKGLNELKSKFCNRPGNSTSDVCPTDQKDQLEYCKGITKSTKKPCPEDYPIVREYITKNVLLSNEEVKIDAQATIKGEIESEYEGTWQCEAGNDVETNYTIGDLDIVTDISKSVDVTCTKVGDYNQATCKASKTLDEDGYEILNPTPETVNAWKNDVTAQKSCVIQSADKSEGLNPAYYEDLWRFLCKDNPSTKNDDRCKCWANYHQTLRDKEGSRHGFSTCADTPEHCITTNAAIAVLDLQDKKFEETSGAQINTTVGGWENIRYCLPGSGCSEAQNKDNPQQYHTPVYQCDNNIQFCSSIIKQSGTAVDSSFKQTNECNFSVNYGSGDDDDGGTEIDYIDNSDAPSGGDTDPEAQGDGDAQGDDDDDDEEDKTFIQKYWWLSIPIVILVFMFLLGIVAVS